MKEAAWLARLAGQLPGWFVWHNTKGWYAAPIAPPATAEDRLSAYGNEYRLGPYRRPQTLRAEAIVRYGAGDHCQTCACPWEQCGHRRDETKP